MVNNPAVSVIVPMYNVEQYIKLCVDSILAQTFADFEVILVDDASPDRCFELCNELYGGNDKVRIIRHEKNLGLGPARNTGIKNARGKYVYFVDSDDYILPDALEKFYNAAEKNNAQVVHAAGRYELVQNADDPVGKGTMTLKWEGYSQEGFLPNKIIYRLEKHWKTYDTRSNAWLCFCRRDFLEQKKIKFLPIISEDEPFSFALFCFTERYYILHEAFYVHLLRQGSIMRSFDVKRLKQGIEAMIIAANYVKKILDKLIPRAEKYEAWRENFMSVFFERFAKNHVVPYYKDKNINPLVNAAAKSTLLPFFGDNEPFVRFLLNYCSLFNNRTNRLLNQGQQLMQQNQQLKNVVSLFTREQPALLKLLETVKTDAKKIFLLGTPDHGNIGDQAIALGERRILQDFFPQHEIIEIPRIFFTGEFGELLWRLGFEEYIRQSDVIFMHGGGNLGNLWLDNEQVRRGLIEKFPDKKIVIFPQSICFTNNDAGHRELAISQKIYNSHKDLYLMARDETSFNFAKKFFPQINNYLLPDAATVLQGITDDCDIDRKGVLFVLRRDKEKIRDDAKIQRLQEYLAAKNIPFTVTDTVINERVTADNREQKIRDVLMKFRAAKVVITDRFHGVIFSFITRTPVLAFRSFDTKISSGIRWFKNLPSIFFAEGQDFPPMEKFIDEHCFAAAEENFAALNVRVDTDSRERFKRALDKIYPNRLTVN